jgi:molecular chaperone HscB
MDALSKKYLNLSWNMHPDKFATKEPHLQSFALQASAILNKAYDTLRDPIGRAEYLLATAGGKSAAEDKRVPQELLEQMMMLREEIEEARAAKDESSITAIRDTVMKQRQNSQQRISLLCTNLEQGGPEVKDHLRLELNSMKYLNSLLTQL